MLCTVACLHCEIHYVYSNAQLPKECTLDKEVFDYECCPNTIYGVCGGPLRGDCVHTVTSTDDQCQDDNNADTIYCIRQRFLQSRPGTNNTDFRYNWPIQIFHRICRCKDNYGGYNCMECRRGYSGKSCSKKLPPAVRKNILSLNLFERFKLIFMLQRAKSHTSSGYTVPIKEPVTSNPRESFIELSLYDAFATMHFYVIRDQEINNCDQCSLISQFCNSQSPCPIMDFAHEGPTFLTWHRAFMLSLETEMQRMFNDPTFAIPYWDWTDETVRDRIWSILGTSDCGIFSDNPNDGMAEAPITGQFDHWDTVCTDRLGIVCNADNQMCNPIDNLGRIKRCIGSTAGVQCRAEGMLPSILEVSVAMQKSSYDMFPYDKEETTDGFRNAMEGFGFLVERNRSVCPDDPGFMITELHNRVHIYVGATFQDVPRAFNDPVFLPHHANVDRLYEIWLEKYSSNNFPSYQPDTFSYDVPPGQNIDEFIVPLFPLITNRQAHQRATSFGYTYEEMTLPAFNRDKAF